MKQALLSIDLGTTSVKVAAFAPDGVLYQQLTRRHTDHSSGERTWQDANSWWEDVAGLIRELLAGSTPWEILGVSLSGRGGAAVFTDARGKVLAHPWSDARHHAESHQLYQWRDEGRHLSNYGAAFLAKYLWLVGDEPTLAEKIVHGFYAKDWLLYRLSGSHRTDWSSGPDARAWDPAIAELGIPATLLPEPGLPWELAGTVTREAAEITGLAEGTPVALGAHDGICANIGAGATRPGDFAITLGTHAVVRAVVDEVPSTAYRFYSLPEFRHIVGGNAVMGGRSADWFVDLTNSAGQSRVQRFAEMDEAAGRVAIGADGVRFLPFLLGQVAPVRRSGARGMFAGLGIEHGQAHLYRAVLEGAAFAVRGIFDQVVNWCGPPERIRMTGSGATSAVWTQILADILNEPLGLSDQAVEGRGAVVCLAVALGMFNNIDEAADVMVPLRGAAVPDPKRVAAYRDVYLHWCEINELSRAFDLADR